MDPLVTAMFVMSVLILLVGVAGCAALYTKVGPNQALIISGMSSEPKIVIGSGSFVLPIVNKKQILSLELMSIDLKNTAPMTTLDGTGIYIDAVIEAQIADDPGSIHRAIAAFGDKDLRSVRSIISDTVFDHAKHMINSNNRQVIVDRLALLSDEIRNASAVELQQLGVVLRAVRIRDTREVRMSLVASDPKALTTTPHIDPSQSLANLSGRIAVVSEPVSTDIAGEITLELQNGMVRRTTSARTRLIGMTIPENTTVVIVGCEGDAVFVEPWSVVHANMPEKVS